MVHLSSYQAKQSANESKEYFAKLGQCARFDQRAKSRQRSGHKAIKETEKPFQTEFNQSKAKTNDNCSKSYRPATHTARE